MDLLSKIEKAQRGYETAKPRSARRIVKHREHVMLKVALLQKKPRKDKRA